MEPAMGNNLVRFNSTSSAQGITIDAAVTGVDALNIGIDLGSFVGPVTVNVANAGARLSIGGPLSGGPASSDTGATAPLNITGAGTLALTGNNTYSGGTILTNGTLAIGNDAALGTGSLSLAGGTAIQAIGGAHALSNNLSVNGDITIGGTNNLTFAGITTLGSSSGTPLTLTVTNSGLTTISGSLAGDVMIPAGGLVKSGSGTLVLSGDQAYVPLTSMVVDGGTLLVNGSFPASNVIVNSGATLGGSGSVRTIAANGAISPGGPGTAILQSGNATFHAGASFVVKLNGTTAGTGYDQLNSSGTVDLSAGPTLSAMVGFPALAGNTFTILTSSNGITGTFSGLANNALLNISGQIFQISYTANSVVLARSTLPTTVTVVSSTNPSVFGQAVTFTATVASGNPNFGTPMGTVQFQIDGTNFGSPVLLSNGMATSGTMSNLAVGRHTVTAIYSGDTNFDSSTGMLTQTVTKASTSATLSASAHPSVFGQSVTFTVTIGVLPPGAGTPTGTVQFQIDGSNAGSPVGVSTSAGVTTASFSTAMLAVGTHTVTANYSGDPNFTPSASALSQTVTKANTAATLSTSANPSVFGQSVTFTVTIGVTPPGAGTPTGTVQFQIDGNNVIGPATVRTTGGLTTASLSDATLEVGSHTISASYNGDSNFLTSAAATLTQVVNPADTLTTITSTVNPSIFSLPVTFTAVVRPMPPGNGTPTGLVTFQDGSRPLGSAALNLSGIATFTTTNLVAGMHSVTAVYSGDLHFNKSTSPAIIQTVTVTPNQAYIAALYQAVLNRSPDTGGFNFWVQQLQAGVSRSMIAQAFELSVEHRVIEVNQFYDGNVNPPHGGFLHRPADDAGRAVWVNALVSGQSEAAVAVAFLTSPEYTAAHSDSASYVGGLYQDVLNHGSDPVGAAYWLDLLQRGVENRAQVALSFLGSPEAFQQAIQFYYTDKNYLNRSPAPAESQAFLDALQRGRLTPTALATTFLASDEFFADAIQRAGG